MSELKYFTDKNIPKAVVDQLRSRGVDVLRIEDVGMDEADDPQLMEFATQEGRAMVSFDQDLLRHHKQWEESSKHHAGIFHIAGDLQGERYIGKLVKELLFYYECVEAGAATIQGDIENHRHFIT